MINIINIAKAGIKKDEKIIQDLEKLGIIVEEMYTESFHIGATTEALSRSGNPWLFSGGTLHEFIQSAKLFLKGVDFKK